MNARVAVITPTRNRLKLLCEAMDSVRRQTFGAWEHVIVDDGSEDGTGKEVAGRAAADARIRYIKRDGGRAGANVCRNLGVREARADLIVFLDSDDLLRPHCLERRVEVMRRNQELDFAVFPAGVFTLTVGDSKRLYHAQMPGDDLLRFLTLECVWEISGPIWRRGFLQKIGCFDDTLLSMQDLEMHVRAISALGKYVYMPEVDHDIRGQNDASKTSTRHFHDPAYILAANEVHAKMLGTVRRSGLLTWTRQRAILGLAFGTAESWVRTGRLARGIQSWIRSCGEQQAPRYLATMGVPMLFAAWAGGRGNGLCARAVNKWKGWVRFRHEPALLEPAREVALAIQEDLA
jgi:glycosyltransferase involved in cell wall biosynthesis